MKSNTIKAEIAYTKLPTVKQYIDTFVISHNRKSR